MIWLLALIGCVQDDYRAPEAPPVIPGPPVVGAAEGHLRLPFGTPLGGFTARCTCLGGSLFDVDNRQSAYNTAFIESAGVQTYPTIKVIWLENGDDHLVITKTDSIYSFDGLVDALEQVLGAETGLDLRGRVIHTTNHSHSSWGTFSDAATFYLGTDKYNEENFQRFRDQVAAVALEAYANRQPARIGQAWAYDWDPEGLVYSDRRGENDDLRPWGEDSPEWTGAKDPWLGMLRFDTLDEQPIAMLFNFGMHGIIGDVDNPMVSGDSGAHVELAVQEQFDEPVVVMFTQGSGGDQSPRGVQDDFAQMESVGALAVDPIVDLWADTPTRADPIRLQTASRSIPQHPSQIRVTRNGTVDWYYLPYEPGRSGDDEVYDAEGNLLSPFDEFNTRVGHVFCGTGDLDFPIGRLESLAYPYANCMDVDLLSALIKTFFKLDELELPLVESLKAATTATRLGPIPVRDPSGAVRDQELLLGFFPGESTSLYTEQFRRRAAAEVGFENAMMISYSQDHEGYLLIPEDWLLGAYEADIVLWGPLQAEHILEGNLQMIAETLSGDVHVDPDPLGYYARTTYPAHDLPTLEPDQTPNAGTEITEPPAWAATLGTDGEGQDLAWIYTPLGIEPQLGIPAQVPRVQQVVQFAWYGGDPGVDNPRVVIERQEGGEWVELTTRAGRPITEALPDILVTTTPHPLTPFDIPQDHLYWAGWQAVSHFHDRTGLPLGTYRLRIDGQHYVGGSTTWPWKTAPYSLTSPPFEVVPATLDISWDGATLSASLPAAADGFRLIHLDGQQRGDNPLVGPVQVSWSSPSGDGSAEVEPVLEGSRSLLQAGVPADATAITVTDAYGNQGSWAP